MKKLLNTFYVIDESAYLSLDGETVVCSAEGKPDLKIPFANIQNIVCFNYTGCSPALMGKCMDKGVSLAFFSPHGQFLGRVIGKSQGNVYTRVRQMDTFEANKLTLVQDNIAAKLVNTRFLVERSLRDHPDVTGADKLRAFSAELKEKIPTIYTESDIEVLRGEEGICAKRYFDLFDILILPKDMVFRMHGRTKHPPLDAVNAVLSFLYAVATNEIASALESVGLDSAIGFYHTLRPGRASLACDLVEEVRCIVDRLVISLINLRILNDSDFEKQISGAVLLNDSGRLKVLKAWQEKKKEQFTYSVIKEKMEYGLLPFVQANLLAKFVRGEVGNYTPYIQR